MDFEKMNFNDLAPLMKIVEDELPNNLICLEANDANIGKYKIRMLEQDEFQITEIDADLTRPCQINYTDKNLSDRINICMVLDGSYQILLDGISPSARVNKFSYHQTFIPDSYYELALHKAKIVHLSICHSYFHKLALDGMQFKSIFENQLTIKEIFLSDEYSLNNSMRNIILDLFANPFTGAISRLFIEAKIIELLSYHLNLVEINQKSGGRYSTRDRNTFNQLKKYLDESFDGDHTLYSLSKEFAINEFKLKHGFKETFGTTVFEYIFEKKMEQAKKLLLKDGLLVGEVASKVGYKNTGNFSVAFKRKFGVNPISLKNI